MTHTSLYDKHFHQFLIKIFGPMSETQITQIFANTQILDFDAGEYLFKQGDTENALYIVLSGRLRVLYQTEKDIHIRGDVSAGEPVGELALFTKEPRSASVVALRKSVVLQLNEADYLVLVHKFPQFALTLTNFVIERLRRNALQHHIETVPKNIAVINLQTANDLSGWTDEIQRQFKGLGIEIRIYGHLSKAKDLSKAIFDEMEKLEGINFLICNDTELEWSNQCITYCDLVVLATEFHEDSRIHPIEKHLNLYAQTMLHTKTYLLLLHPDNAPLPTHTRRWFKGRSLDLHIHVRQNNLKDIRRFCRIVAHQAVGLVLGGGGAKGYAHFGVANALMESGIEFDFVGGSSAGALNGLCMAYNDFDIKKIYSIAKISASRKVTSNDYTFPFLSLMTGNKMRNYLKELFEEAYLEDVWINSFGVSTNYSTSSLKVHERGLIRQQLEASIAIPGVFPPVVIDNQLHVDGGVTDNLPIETMYLKPVRHVIAVSLTSQAPHFVELEKIPTTRQMFWNKITKAKPYMLPNMTALLVNSMTLNSRNKQEVTKSQVAIYLEMDLTKFHFLDWSKWEPLIRIGYEQTQAYLKTVSPEKQFWKK